MMQTETAQPGDETRLRADARRNRERVLEAGWRLLREKHPSELSMEEVAREADVGKGTLYRHYPTREALLDALVEEGARRLIASMHDRIPPEADAPTKLRTLVALLYDGYEQHNLNLEVLLLMTERVKREGGHVAHPFSAVPTRVRAILEQGVREGSFAVGDLDFAALAVLTLTNPLSYAKYHERLGYGRARLEELVVDMLLRALRAESPPAPNTTQDTTT
jgi:AcrR family transcriptional regulator